MRWNFSLWVTYILADNVSCTALKNKFTTPQGGLEQFVILRTFRHISRFFSILWVNLRTQRLFESGLPCQTLTPDQNLTYIMQTISRITLINLVMGRMEGEGGGCVVKGKVKQKSNQYFISFWTCGEASACACFTSPRDDFTTWPSLPPSGLMHLLVFAADKQTRRDQSSCQRDV